LARRFMEARVKADLDALDEMMTPDYVSHAKLLPDQQPDREGEKWVVAQFAAAFSKRRLLIEDQVAGADKVVTRFIVHFTPDRGEIMGVAPSGREMTNRAIVVHRIVEGKIAEEWGLGTLGSKLRGQSLKQGKLERERVEQELKLARSIQHASLPKDVPPTRGLADLPLLQAS
jgi:ketosteroid isomerase-like protein